jgi:hypothetical protein
VGSSRWPISEHARDDRSVQRTLDLVGVDVCAVIPSLCVDRSGVPGSVALAREEALGLTDVLLVVHSVEFHLKISTSPARMKTATTTDAIHVNAAASLPGGF